MHFLPFRNVHLKQACLVEQGIYYCKSPTSKGTFPLTHCVKELNLVFAAVSRDSPGENVSCSYEGSSSEVQNLFLLPPSHVYEMRIMCT